MKPFACLRRHSFSRIWLLGALLLLISQSLLAATCTTGFINGITGTYYKNINFTGASATRVDSSIDFDWSTGSPGVGSLGTDTFSVRWSGNLRAPVTGNYQFQTTSDDGVRLWVNGVQIINNWNDHSVTTDTSASVSLVAGQSYPVVMEFYENGGYAVAKLYWNQPGSATFVAISTQAGVTGDTSAFCTVPTTACTSGMMGGALGKYYNNMTLTGTPVTRNDTTIDFNWAAASPGVTGIGADNFSVRWDATLKVPTTGSYQFETVSDDGVRLYVNNVLVINNWTDHSQTSNTSSAITLTAGVSYPLRMEFYENGGSAVAALHWKIPSSSSYVTLNGCPSTVAGYTIAHSGTGITCTGEPITITAVDSTGSAVAPTVGTTVTLSTSPATGTWVGGNTYTFTGTETSFIKYLQQITASTLGINVTDGTYTELAGSDPAIIFVTAALKFSTITTREAGVTDNSVKLQAIRTDNNTGACVAQVTGTQSVKLAYICRNPATCIAGETLTLGGTSIQSNPNSALANPTYNSVNLTFDNTGTASIPLNYSDVGQLSLAAQVQVAASGNNPAITLAGTSSPFVVKPYSLAVSAVQTATGTANPGGTSNALERFVSAGTNFKVFVQARDFSGNPTPNFGNESPASEIGSLAINATSIVYPAGGTLTALTNGGSFTATAPAGTFVNSAISWKQVGSFVITPSLSDADYLGGGNIANITDSGTVGRIYPERFALSNLSFTNACSSFAYMSQPLPLSYKLQAQAVDGTLLTNFAGNYGLNQLNVSMLASIAYVAESNNTGDGASISSRALAIPVGSAPVWTAGEYVFNGSLQFSRQPSTAPDGPFANLQLGVQVVDNFDSRSLSGADMDATTATACTTTCNAKALGTAVPMRYGRLRLDDAYGPETVKLPVTFVTEYWNGNRFSLNTIDSCTLVPRSAITYPAGTLTTDANRTVTLSGGTTQGSYTNLDASGVNFNAGSAGQSFSAPTGGGTGSFIVGVNLTTLAWLRYDWNQDGNYSDTSLPNATFRFSSYRGNDRLIYWREKL